MKIKNVSVKVIGILGQKDLMPDESMDCNESIVKNPAVETLIKMGFLKVDDSEEKAKALKEQAIAEARAQILKEQEEAAAKVATSDAADAATDKDAAAPEAPKKRRATKAPEAANDAAE